MKFEFSEKISHPRDRVYELLKDGLTELIPLVPNVKAVNELERRPSDDAGRVHIVNEWEGDPGSTPKIIRPFVKQEMQRWKDFAHWDDNRMLVEWEFESAFLTDLYDCGGINYVEDGGNDTSVVRITGNLVTYPSRVRGVPKALGGKIGPTLEKWVLNLVSPNLAELPKAVQRYLDES